MNEICRRSHFSFWKQMSWIEACLRYNSIFHKFSIPRQIEKHIHGSFFLPLSSAIHVCCNECFLVDYKIFIYSCVKLLKFGHVLSFSISQMSWQMQYLPPHYWRIQENHQIGKALSNSQLHADWVSKAIGSLLYRMLFGSHVLRPEVMIVWWCWSQFMSSSFTTRSTAMYESNITWHVCKHVKKVKLWKTSCTEPHWNVMPIGSLECLIWTAIRQKIEEVKK